MYSSRRTGFLCVIYASESRTDLVSRILSHVTTGVLQAHHFIDTPYNRTGIYLVSTNSSLLCNAALRICQEAFSIIDFRSHKGSHPALGAVDHCCLSPLGELTDELLQETVELGLEFGQRLNNQEGIDIYYYSAASARGSTLRSIRKDLIYFSKFTSIKDSTLILPDIISDIRHQKTKGITCVGVAPMIINFNIRMTTLSSINKKLVSQITSLLRVPGAVEALTLHWGAQLEIACNLLSPLAEHCPSTVLAKAMSLATERGLVIETSYTTGPSENELLDNLLPHHGSI